MMKRRRGEKKIIDLSLRDGRSQEQMVHESMGTAAGGVLRQRHEQRAPMLSSRDT